MQELPSERLRRHLPVLFLALACLLCFGLRAHYILLSGYDEVLKGVEDDTYYYLQPAWYFRQLGFYTFDGVGKMYGFQPLWMVIVTALSYVCSDKEVFLRATLLLATVFYIASGIVLYRLVRTQKRELGSAVAVGVFWFLNPWLAEVLTRGKENALQAFLLLVATSLVDSLLKSESKASATRLVGLGAVTGLLFLARINSILFPALFGVGYLIASRRRLPAALRDLVFCAIGFVVASVPWLLYAQLEFGTAFPLSGAAKLRWFSYQHFIELFIPLTVFRIARSIGGVYRDLFPQLGVVFLGGAFAVFRARASLGPLLRPSAVLSACLRALEQNLGLAALVAYAVINLFTTLVFLSPWFDYGVWYHVRERAVRQQARRVGVRERCGWAPVRRRSAPSARTRGRRCAARVLVRVSVHQIARASAVPRLAEPHLSGVFDGPQADPPGARHRGVELRAARLLDGWVSGHQPRRPGQHARFPGRDRLEHRRHA